MTRRGFFALPLLLAGCGLAERPYVERREWPLMLRRPDALPPRRGGPVLEVRTLDAGPGLESRGLKSLTADGSLRTSFYEEWAVPPAQAIEDSLRLWLAASGKFGAVVAPDSRMQADLALEGELTALWAEPGQNRAQAAMAVTLIDQRGTTPRILLQRTFRGEAKLGSDTPPDAVGAQLAALTEVFRQIEAAIPG
jgi:cholesterol transport system auxiliary component